MSQNIHYGKDRELKQAYAMALQDYLRNGGEDALRSAYEIGRIALADGFGVLAMADMHYAAVAQVLQDIRTPRHLLRRISIRHTNSSMRASRLTRYPIAVSRTLPPPYAG